MKTDLESAIEALQNLVLPLRQGEFSMGLGKVSVYVQSVAKSWDLLYTALQALEQKRAIDPEEYSRDKEALKLSFQK